MEKFVELLKKRAFLGGLDDNRLKEMLKHLKKESFKKDEIVINEGEVGDKMYIIAKGSVRVIKKFPGTDEYEDITVLGEGDSFGEMELIDIQNRAATIKAIEPLDTFSLSNADLLQLSKVDQEMFCIIVINIARIISRRLRFMDDKIVSLHHQ